MTYLDAALRRMRLDVRVRVFDASRDGEEFAPIWAIAHPETHACVEGTARYATRSYRRICRELDHTAS